MILQTTTWQLFTGAVASILGLGFLFVLVFIVLGFYNLVFKPWARHRWTRDRRVEVDQVWESDTGSTHKVLRQLKTPKAIRDSDPEAPEYQDCYEIETYDKQAKVQWATSYEGFKDFIDEEQLYLRDYI